MTDITPMECYATTDGRLHTDKIEAQAHQYGLDMKDEISAFVGYDPKSIGIDSRNAYGSFLAVTGWEVSKRLKELRNGQDTN